jgi:putative (di)nucleoside polyphosphate hydrolase
MNSPAPDHRSDDTPAPSLPYRPCVGVMLVNDRGAVFVGQRIDMRENSGADGEFWQMPQGGIDEGEDVRAAALRELAEETGLTPDKVRFVAQTERELRYDLPAALVGKLWGGRYCGQRQHWVLLRFTGEDADVRLDAYDPAEFSSWQWVAPDRLPDLIVPFKKDVYRAVLDQFRPLI